ncbi:MAG: type II CAAX prenyl endopeptidase Rce1 family protein [Bacillota bacterium]
MKGRWRSWVAGQPVIAFYVLTFIITWLGWVPQAAYSHGLFPFDSIVFYILGGVGPMLAAYLVLRVTHGKEAETELFAPLLRWRAGAVWYAAAFLGNAMIWVCALALSGQPVPSLAMLVPILPLLPTFFVRLLAAVPEEVAWRGFALPRLQSRYNALISSTIVAVAWALWHLPLLMTKGNVMSTYPLMPYLIAIVARSIVYTWLYNSTNGSAFIATLYHGLSNMVGPFVGVEQTIIECVLAVILVVVFGAEHLTRRGGRIVHSTGVSIQ